MFLLLLLTISISSITSIEIDSDQLFQPKFDRSYETVSVVVGKRALLPCYVSLQDTKTNGIASFKVIWMKLNNSAVLTMEDRAINGDSRISLLHAYAEEWNLQIDEIDEDDAGVYQCFINTGMYKTVVLEVKVPPKIVDELTTEPYPPPVQTGSNFTIKCYAHGKPTPNIRILAYDQTDSPKIISESNEVTLHNLSRHTNRRYECIASNGYPPDVARSFQLTIQYPPETILFTNEEVLSDLLFINSNRKEIRLKCQVMMNPFGKIFWLKDNKKLNSDYQIYQINNYFISELIIKHFTNEQQGVYKCIASNSLGFDSKDIHLYTLSTTTTTTTEISMERITLKRKRIKYTRTTTTTDTILDSTESLRMMTLSSKATNYPYHTMILIILLITVIYLN